MLKISVVSVALLTTSCALAQSQDYVLNVMRADAKLAMQKEGFKPSDIDDFSTMGMMMVIHTECGEQYQSATHVQQVANMLAGRLDIPLKILMEKALVFAKIESDDLKDIQKRISFCRMVRQKLKPF